MHLRLSGSARISFRSARISFRSARISFSKTSTCRATCFSRCSCCSTCVVNIASVWHPRGKGAPPGALGLALSTGGWASREVGGRASVAASHRALWPQPQHAETARGCFDTLDAPQGASVLRVSAIVAAAATAVWRTAADVCGGAGVVVALVVEVVVVLVVGAHLY
eukprot:scaffold5140_cov55-Phaeocystis_antarctica.AAC.1